MLYIDLPAFDTRADLEAALADRARRMVEGEVKPQLAQTLSVGLAAFDSVILRERDAHSCEICLAGRWFWLASSREDVKAQLGQVFEQVRRQQALSRVPLPHLPRG